MPNLGSDYLLIFLRAQIIVYKYENRENSVFVAFDFVDIVRNFKFYNCKAPLKIPDFRVSQFSKKIEAQNSSF